MNIAGAPIIAISAQALNISSFVTGVGKMQNQQFDSTAVEKLQRLIKSRFGKDIKLRQLIDARTRNTLKDYHLIGEDLHVNLQQDEHILGTVIVPNASDLKSDAHQQMCQIIRMVMEPTLYSWFLERKENNLRQINTYNFSTQNLSVFDELIRDEIISDDEDSSYFDLQSKDEDLALDEINNSGSGLVSKIIHLCGKSESLNRKVALQIHDMAHRWAFVPIQDMAASIENVQDLQKLGALTLYVDKIETLDYKLQLILLEYLELQQNEEEPLIISTSELSNLDIKNSESLVLKLKEFMLTNTFEVDQAPLGYNHLKEVLEMFFFKPALT